MMKSELKDIIESVKQIHLLQQNVVRQTLAFYKPEVEDIIHQDDKDEQRIEHALDHLLDLAFDDQILKLYKQLCRHYYYINPQATAEYIYAYRDMWDTEENAE